MSLSSLPRPDSVAALLSTAALAYLPGTIHGVSPEWAAAYEMTLAWIEEHGTLPVKRTVVGTYHLGKWLQRQRTAARQGKLNEHKVALLSQIEGWEWDRRVGTYPDQEQWLQRRQQLLDYLTARDSNILLFEGQGDARVLYDWVRLQRQNYPKHLHHLHPDRVRLLEEIPGWTWDTPPDRRRTENRTAA